MVRALTRRRRFKDIDVEESRQRAVERVAILKREEKQKLDEFLNRESKYSTDFVEKSRAMAMERVKRQRSSKENPTMILRISTSSEQKRGSSVDIEEVLRRTKQRIKMREEAARKFKVEENLKQKKSRYEEYDSEEMMQLAKERVKKHQMKMS